MTKLINSHNKAAPQPGQRGIGDVFAQAIKASVSKIR
jgi:hypothetical protein